MANHDPGPDGPEGWLARARAGDRHALNRLLEWYRPRLRDWAASLVGAVLAGAFDCSDAVQDTCLQVVDDLGQFRGTSLAEFEALLSKVLERVVGNARRTVVTGKRGGGHARVDLDPDLLHDRDATPSAQLALGEDASLVRAAMAGLPPDQAKALELFYLEGMSRIEVAQAMGRSVDSVRGLLERAIKVLGPKLRALAESNRRGPP